jgi:hypothetical protein
MVTSNFCSRMKKKEGGRMRIYEISGGGQMEV